MKLFDIRDQVIREGNSFLENLTEEIYILGTNKYGASTSKWLAGLGKNLKGFVNDYIIENSFEEYPVFKSAEVPENSAIVNCIVEGRCIDARNHIRTLQPMRSVSYFSLQSAFSDVLPDINFLSNTDSIFFDRLRYEVIYNLLVDFDSKKHFLDVLNFRFNRSLSYLDSYKFSVDDQYFEDFISLPKNSCFVDAGGFDGVTSLKFSKCYIDYSRIFYFEPSIIAFEISETLLRGLSGVIYFRKGLWSSNTVLKFDSNLGNASKISESGSDFIETVSLDDVILEKIDFIKLDIEGAEKEALKGSREVILKYRPIIAVCVYHNQIDFIDIPEFLLNLVPDYRIYFRHYTQGVCESVMYFV